ncbi:hypothetical protein D3C76_410620 [compost metagenome]
MSLDPWTFTEKAIVATVGLGVAAFVGFLIKERHESNKYVERLAKEFHDNQKRKGASQ